MSRPEASDPLQNFRFHVRTDSGQGMYSDNEGGEAGFQSCSLPEYSADAVEYKEGKDTFTKKYPGPPTVSDVSLMRGATKKDTSFYDWMMTAINGGSYRTDLTIFHWHRDGKTAGKIGDFDAARKYLCYECFPIRMKPAADLDSTSGDVAVAEMDISVEYFEIEDAS